MRSTGGARLADQLLDIVRGFNKTRIILHLVAASTNYLSAH